MYMYIHISCKQDLGDQIKLLSVSLYVTHLQEKMCECTAFFLSYTCVYACITLSRGRALGGFTCSCRVLHFVLCTTCMKTKAKDVPKSLCLCYRSSATFSFWCNGSAGRAEVRRSQSKSGGTGRFGTAQRPVCMLGVQLFAMQCRCGTQTLLFGGLCAQCLLIYSTYSQLS